MNIFIFILEVVFIFGRVFISVPLDGKKLVPSLSKYAFYGCMDQLGAIQIIRDTFLTLF
jgi:hypothetical protein